MVHFLDGLCLVGYKENVICVIKLQSLVNYKNLNYIIFAQNLGYCD